MRGSGCGALGRRVNCLIMSAKTISLSIAALICFAAAYRFGSHGLRLHDDKCIALAVAAIAVAGVLLWLAFRDRATRPTA